MTGRQPRPRGRMRGFTLTELMIVLMIIAIIAAIAVPGFSTLMQRTRLKTYANELVSSVYLARSEAIKRDATVRLCASSNGSSCNGAGSWQQGWIVIDPNDTVIRHQDSMQPGFVMFELSSAGFETMEFNPSGIASAVANFKICQQSPTEGIEEKRVAISLSGRPRVDTLTTGCP